MIFKNKSDFKDILLLSIDFPYFLNKKKKNVVCTVFELFRFSFQFSYQKIKMTKQHL